MLQSDSILYKNARNNFRGGYTVQFRKLRASGKIPQCCTARVRILKRFSIYFFCKNPRENLRVPQKSAKKAHCPFWHTY